MNRHREKSRAIARVQAKADARAELAAAQIRQFAGLNLLLATVKPNYRFYRRLAGLRGVDVTEAK